MGSEIYFNLRTLEHYSMFFRRWLAVVVSLYIQVDIYFGEFWQVCLPPMGCGAAEATGLGFVCFVVINRCVVSQHS